MHTSLDSLVAGPVLSAADARMAEEVAGFDTSLRHSPDVVVGATSAQDVVESVRWARAHGLPVAVQGTGHGTHRAVTSGVLVTTWRLDRVRVDAAAGTATVGAGAQWADVIDAAAPRGLAPVAASDPSVGVVGFLLGGGLGPFARSHGFGSDHVEAFTVVTGAGDLVEASATSDPELLWALRGGHHGLGVVTGVRLRLAAVPSLLGGYLAFTEEHVPAVVRGWLDWTRDAHPDVTTNLTVVHLRDGEGPLGHLPSQRLALLFVAFPGEADEGERLVAPLRALAPRAADTVGPMDLTDLASMYGAPMVAGPSWVRGTMLGPADGALADTWLSHVGPGEPHPFTATQLRHIGSACAVDVPEGSAVAGRAAEYTALVVGQDPALFGAMPQAAETVLGALAPWRTAELNPNFAGNGQGRWAPEVARRLEAVRRRVDPDGLLTPRR